MNDAKEKIKQQAVLEKRFWLKISNACNNKCIFCLDSEFRDPLKFIPADVLRKKIAQAAADSYTRLILSGGEASIHPDFIDLIDYARSIGFAKIQTISNGRMFSYKSFAHKAVTAGLTEATFSIHGPDPEIHDTLTGIRGSFGQALRGVRNIIETGKCIVSIDIVINKLNYRHAEKIIRLFSEFHIYEYDLLFLVPFGRAYTNRDSLFVDYREAAPYLDKIFSYANSEDYFIWTNRFPAYLLENHEKLIQDPHKIYDEINGRKDNFDFFYRHNRFFCEDEEKCSACFLTEFCIRFRNFYFALNGEKALDGIICRDDFEKKQKKHEKLFRNSIDLTINLDDTDKIKNRETIKKLTLIASGKLRSISDQILHSRPDVIVLTHISEEMLRFLERELAQKQIKICIELNDSSNRILLAYSGFPKALQNLVSLSVPSYEIYADAEKNYELVNQVIDKYPQLPVLNCAPCIHPKGYFTDDSNTVNLDLVNDDGRPDLNNVVKDYILNGYFVKSLRCDDCSENKRCRGMNINYIRYFSFKILKVIE